MILLLAIYYTLKNVKTHFVVKKAFQTFQTFQDFQKSMFKLLITCFFLKNLWNKVWNKCGTKRKVLKMEIEIFWNVFKKVNFVPSLFQVLFQA